MVAVVVDNLMSDSADVAGWTPPREIPSRLDVMDSNSTNPARSTTGSSNNGSGGSAISTAINEFQTGVGPTSGGYGGGSGMGGGSSGSNMALPLDTDSGSGGYAAPSIGSASGGCGHKLWQVAGAVSLAEGHIRNVWARFPRQKGRNWLRN